MQLDGLIGLNSFHGADIGFILSESVTPTSGSPIINNFISGVMESGGRQLYAPQVAVTTQKHHAFYN